MVITATGAGRLDAAHTFLVVKEKDLTFASTASNVTGLEFLARIRCASEMVERVALRSEGWLILFLHRQ